MRPRTREDWESVPPDPDPRADLDYDPVEVEVIRSEDGVNGHVLLLPTDEDLLREEAFVIAAPDAISDLGEMR